MSAIVTAFSSTATSALACRDGLSALADLYRDLGTASSQEISQTMRVLESIPSPPVPGPHTGPVGSTMMKIAEKTRNVRQSLSTHVLELEFLGCEAETLALGVAPLADAFPLPAAPQHAVRPAPYEERPVPCEKCGRPLGDVFRNCQHCESASIKEAIAGLKCDRIVTMPAGFTVATPPLTVIDDVEADIATITDDLKNGRVTVGETLTADERRHKRHAEVMAAQANADAIARLEEAEYDQLPAAVYGRGTTEECVATMANSPVVEEIPPPVLMHCPHCRPETLVPAHALGAVLNCPTCILTEARAVPLYEGPAPEAEPAPEPAAKKPARKRRK